MNTAAYHTTSTVSSSGVQLPHNEAGRTAAFVATARRAATPKRVRTDNKKF